MKRMGSHMSILVFQRIERGIYVDFRIFPEPTFTKEPVGVTDNITFNTLDIISKTISEN